jgi:cytochrome P450
MTTITSERGEPLSFDPFELADTVGGKARDVYPYIAELRRQAPVHRGPMPIPGEPTYEYGESEDYSIYSHEHVVAVLRDNTRFSSSVYKEVIGVVMGRTILEMDEPEHRVHRALVSPAFRQKVLARWETELVESVVDDLVGRFEHDGEAELVRQFTFSFPVQVIARILGLPREDYPRFQRWSIELLSVVANWDRGVAASTALREYFRSVLEERRRHPADDLISDLANIEVEGRRLEDEEIFSFLLLLLPAGVETTYRSSGNLLFGLLTDPQSLAAVQADPSLLPQAMEEGLRWESPIVLLMRRATEEVSLGGVEIQEGANLAVVLGSANRDETRYEAPDVFDIWRDPKQHVTFGFGPHMCLGMHLARMETRVAVTRLLARLPRVELAPGDHDAHIEGVAFRSPTALPVRF